MLFIEFYLKKYFKIFVSVKLKLLILEHCAHDHFNDRARQFYID